MKKQLIIHFHIFKNAGTTIDSILKNSFLKNALSLDTNSHKGRISFEEVIKYINTKGADVKSFSSHQIRFPLPDSQDFNFLRIIFIRHPIDRALSVYYFNRKRPDAGGDLTTQKAREYSLKEYVNWLILQEKNMVIKNHQVLFLSGKPRGSSVNLEDLELAKSRLAECELPGVVDRMNDSLILGEETFRKYFDKINFSYKNENVIRMGSLEEKLDKGRKELGEKLYSKLEDVNKYDFELYKFANQNLDKQLQKIQDYDIKLENFEKRCEKLNGTFRSLFSK